jgi:hypothetical protein
VPGALSPWLAQCAVRLGAEVPFAVAADLLEVLTGTRVSAATIRRLTEAAGAACVRLETAVVARLEGGASLPPVGVPAEPLQLSVDGVMVPLVRGQWKELRLAAIGRVTAGPEGTVATTELSYAARLLDAAGFGRAALGEIERRGVAHAPVVVAVSDGAPWIQEFVDLHCPRAVRILDFAHAAGYLAEAAQAAFGPGTPATSEWFAAQRHALRHENPAAVLAAVDALPPGEARDRARHYLGERLGMLAYADFAARGYPIGSGCVESANKLVIEARLKGSGMHWTEAHADAMAALRCVLRNHRWTVTWPQIVRHLRARRPAAVAARRAAAAPPVAPAPPAPPAAPVSARPTTPRAKTIVHGRPTAAHPWRRCPVFPHRPLPATPPRPN